MTAPAAKATPIRPYLLAVVGGWLILAWGAFEYARMKGIPGRIAAPIGAAFLVEFPFYLLPGFPQVRDRFAALGRGRAALAMLISAALPYLVYAVPTGVFEGSAFGLLALISAAVAFWHVLIPAGALRDALFLLLLATVVLTKVLNRIYLSPWPALHVEYLGHIILIRLAAMAMLAIRRDTGVEFRFWPTAREWLTGARWFALGLPCAAAAYWAMGLVEWRPSPLGIPLAIGVFFSMLWVVALSEEFFFRGLLERWLEGWLGGSLAALIAASVLFGAAHLEFARAFPNWRFSIVATIAGVFYGLAWRETRTVQSSMVTHALLVTVWRVFLK